MQNVKLSYYLIGMSILFSLFGCGGGGGGSTSTPPTSTLTSSPVTYTAASGVAEKGPLIKGSSVAVQELDSSLSPTGKQYSFQITSDLGTFSPTSSFGSQYIGLNASGYYFDEVQNEVSAGTITLNGYSNLAVDSVLNVNLLTTLAYQRIQNLIKNSKMTFAAARAQAETEVLVALNIRNAPSFTSFGTLDISKGTNADNMLAAISALFVNGNSSGQLSSLIANFQSDIADNGLIDNATTNAALVTSAKTLNISTVAANLTSKYASLGLSFTSSNLSNWIATNGDGVLGSNQFSVANALASTSYTSTAYLVSAKDNGNTFSVTAGTMLINGAPVTGSVKVNTGDSIAISLTSGSNPGDTVSGYIDSNSINIVSFNVHTAEVQLSLLGTITGIGIPNDLRLSSNNILYIASNDSASGAPFNLDGGLYAYNVASPTAPIKLSLSQFPASNFISTDYNNLYLSADGNTVYVASAQQEFQIFNVSTPSNPTLTSRLGTIYPAVGLTVSTSTSTAFVSTFSGSSISGNNLLQINVANLSSPSITITQSTGSNPVYDLNLSPDGTQISGIENQGQAVELGISNGILNGSSNPISIPNVSGGALNLSYIGSGTLFFGNLYNSVSVANISVPSTPVAIGQLTNLPNPNVGGYATEGVLYTPSNRLAYVAQLQQPMPISGGPGAPYVLVSIYDLSNPANPVLRGAISVPTSTSLTPNYYQIGLSASSNGKTIYVVSGNQISIIGVGS